MGGRKGLEEDDLDVHVSGELGCGRVELFDETCLGSGESCERRRGGTPVRILSSTT